ncbi:T9SS type A sorting domain-containing protein [Flavitalea flava]
MNYIYSKGRTRFLLFFAGLAGIFFQVDTANAQSCPAYGTTQIGSFPNTYFPTAQNTLNSGSTSISIGKATNGTDAISSGDILLVIQMQGAEIDSTNTVNYGGQGPYGSGYLNNSNMMAGNMEFVVASNAVPVTGGTLNLVKPLINSYKNAPSGKYGQYTFQIIRVPLYNSVKLTSSITAPAWNLNSGGVYTGGVLVLYSTDTIDFNSKTISVAGMGFRGGGGRKLGGDGSSTSLLSSDYLSKSGLNANGSKGEGISGTPNYVNKNNVLYATGVEGYPGGSFAQGAPGNAGGGGSDGNPSSNDQNTGGGGGGNGGPGGNGGNAWSSSKTTGGRPGAIFAQGSVSRMIMGGGGGAGTTNDGTGTPNSGVASSGAAGGGIVIIFAKNAKGIGTINANGADGNTTISNDGAGGGGAGGSVMVFFSSSGLTNITITAKGGNGGINYSGVTSGGSPHGPGGGGGGGVIYSNTTLNAASTVSGGVAGTTFGSSPNYGAISGSAGTLNQNISQPPATAFPVVCSILSLNFLGITAGLQNDAVTINWEVSQEVEVSKYVVERSQDGQNYAAIGSTPYRVSAEAVNHYQYDDNSGPVSSVAYYRIKEIDFSGSFMYSKVVAVRVSGSPASKLSVFPNPTKGAATVSFTSAVQANISLRLFSLNGSQVGQQQYHANIGENFVPLEIVRNLPTGVYILQWFDGIKPEQVKLFVNR